MQVSQEKEFHLPGEHTNMIVWQLQSKNHKVILCKLFSPPIPAFPCCCVSLPSGALLNQWTALLEVSISLQFSAVFSCAESHRQFQPVHSCIPAHRNYFALLPAPCLGCMFKPPLFSCQHWKSQGHAGSKFNNLTKSFFCLFCYRQTKGRENAPLLSSSLKSGSN